MNTSKAIGLTPDQIRERFGKLRSTTDLALLLDVTYERLTWHIWRRPRSARYTHFHIKKRRGGTREIVAPSRVLRLLQRKTVQVLSAVFTPRPAAHGFVAERSIVTNAREHVRRRFVLNIDLKDFFPSIHFGRVRGMFMAWPYNLPPAAATALAQVCFAGEPGLPQGAPTSPIVSNMVCAAMDADLVRLAAKHRCTYSRYSDDITFSTTKGRFPRDLANYHNGVLQLGPGVQAIVDDHGFSVNLGKLRLQSRFERQEVTGLIVNERVNVPRTFIRQIRAMLHAWEKFDTAAAEREFRARWDSKHRSAGSTPPSFVDVVAGKLVFLGMVRGHDDPTYTTLVQRARVLSPRFESLPTRDDAVLVVERKPFAAFQDDIYVQGTGFIVDGVGFVTAAHVVLKEDGSDMGEMQVFHAGRVARRADICLVHRHRDSDSAIARMPFRNGPRLRVGDAARVNRGDVLTVLGFPFWAPGQGCQQTEVKVVGRKDVFGIGRILVDRTIQKGNSGGPVLNARGEVIGIAVTGSSDGSEPNGIVPISAVLADVRKHGLDLSTLAAYTPP